MTGPQRPTDPRRRPAEGVLSSDELRAVANRFGAADDQVIRDHAISHVLGAISADLSDAFLFFGGTALSRTHLTNQRLSEDIDLIAAGERTQAVTDLKRVLDTRLRRTLGRPTWDPDFVDRDTEAGVLILLNGSAIKLQVLRSAGYAPWPTERRDIDRRYSDVPDITLVVPTLPSFAAWKTSAWQERAAARDLYDLWAMSQVGAIDGAAGDLFAKFAGPYKPRPWMFTAPPTEKEWKASLGAQTRLTITARQALHEVRTAWATALGEDWATD